LPFSYKKAVIIPIYGFPRNAISPNSGLLAESPEPL